MYNVQYIIIILNMPKQNNGGLNELTRLRGI